MNTYAAYRIDYENRKREAIKKLVDRRKQEGGNIAEEISGRPQQLCDYSPMDRLFIKAELLGISRRRLKK